MKTKRKDYFEPYWQEVKDWLCTIEFLNTRWLALLGDADAGAYELLFSFSSPEEKNGFLNLVRSNEDMGNGLHH